MQPVNKKHSTLILAVFFFLGIMANQQAMAATPVPHFTLQSAVDGSMIDSAGYNGKVMLVTFFATWCPPCRAEVPALIQLQKEYTPRGFSVVGISVDQSGRDEVSRFIAKNGINYPVVMANDRVTKDFKGIWGIPVSFLVDRSGQIRKRYEGYVEQEIYQKDIGELLAR